MWDGSETVGFGVKGKWAAAWFCDYTGGDHADSSPQEYVDNIEDVCLVGAVKAENFAGYNRCYNNAALQYHNEKRSLHKDTPLLVLDEKIATAIQKAMDKTEFTTKNTGVIADKGDYVNCGEGKFEQTVVAKVKDLATSNAASERWYKGESDYSYEKGTAKEATDVAKSAAARDFAQMVWKSTTKVGFGVKGKWVIAWYCEAAASTGSPTESVANVGEKCIDSDGVNTCYADRALLAHNTRRAYHESGKLEHDAANSKKL
jgi:hypothetical protein